MSCGEVNPRGHAVCGGPLPPGGGGRAFGCGVGHSASPRRFGPPSPTIHAPAEPPLASTHPGDLQALPPQALPPANSLESSGLPDDLPDDGPAEGELFGDDDGGDERGEPPSRLARPSEGGKAEKTEKAEKKVKKVEKAIEGRERPPRDAGRAKAEKGAKSGRRAEGAAEAAARTAETAAAAGGPGAGGARGKYKTVPCRHWARRGKCSVGDA